MKFLTCAAVRGRLQSLHDGELPVGDQVDVSAHLDGCEHCTSALEEMQALRVAVRAALPRRSPLSDEEHAGLRAVVVSRIRAENTEAWSARLCAMFDDMHMVYAGLGAASATVVCVMIMLGMTRFATRERSPGSNQNPVVVDARMLMPRPLSQVLMTAGVKDADDAVFTLSAVVTREGRVVNLELYSETGETLGADSSEARAFQTLMGSVSRARFEPAKVAGLPVAVSMVWMVAQTTVRASLLPLTLDAPVTASAKKRRA